MRKITLISVKRAFETKNFSNANFTQKEYETAAAEARDAGAIEKKEFWETVQAILQQEEENGKETLTDSSLKMLNGMFR